MIPADYTETAILFGTTSPLTGIVTEPYPPAEPVRRTGVILLNAGVVHRVGPGRLYVALARRLARAGFSVLRFDHAGIGDSPPRSDHLPFEEGAVLEAADAMNWLAENRACTAFALIGLCSGTLTAFRTAAADPRVTELVLLTALLQDPSTVPPELIRAASERRIAVSYRTEKIGSARMWGKVLTGRANYARIFRSLRQWLGPAPPSTPADPGTTEVIAVLERLLTRGASVSFVFAEPTTVLEYFRMTLSPGLRRLRQLGRLDVTVLSRADHTFTELRHQTRVIDLVSDWLAPCS